MKKQCFLDNHWLWEITIWIFFCKKMLFLFPEPTKGTRTNTNLWYVSKLTTVPKTKEMSQKLRVSLLKSLLDVFWMLLEPNHQAFTETTKLVAKKPQKVWFYCIEGAMTSHLPKHSQHKSWIFVFTFHNPQQQNKGQKDPRKDKDVTGGISTQIAKFSQSFSEKEKTQHKSMWGCHPTWARTWALSNGVERDTWVTKKWRLWSSLGFN